jgi:hypothetical protein
VDPLDTILKGMDKSYSDQNNYEYVQDPHLGAEQGNIPLSSSLQPSSSSLNSQPGSGLSHTAIRNVRVVQGISQSVSDVRSPQQGNFSQLDISRNTPAKSVQNSRQESTAKLAEKQQRRVSNAPQTKHDQQNLLTASKAVSNEMDNSRVDLEKLIRSIFAGTKDADLDDSNEQEEAAQEFSGNDHTQPDPSNEISLTRRDAIKVSRIIFTLLKQRKTSPSSQARKTGLGFNVATKICPKCNYVVARACDMKKHMKRHDKPYGCTYPKCHKRFGAKSDWKRHENSQHFQLEAYRCGLASATRGKPCGEHFLRIDHFKKHLEASHGVADERTQGDEAKRRRIGKNCQGQFWCGFHGEIVELKEKRNAAWDERFDHVAWHFEKEKRSIEEWICAEENKSKKDLLREMDRWVFDDEDERGEGVGGSSGDGVPPPPSQHPPNVFPAPLPQTNLFHQDLILNPQMLRQTRGSRKRVAPDDVSQSLPKRRHREAVLNVYCVCVIPSLITCLANAHSAHAETVRTAARCKLHVMLVSMNFKVAVNMLRMRDMSGHELYNAVALAKKKLQIFGINKCA